jgi:NDP-sugar pyrophosphorylase family protein
MEALILAGGKGTRLRPLTVYTPKPIVPVMNRPFLLFQLESLKRAGITDITLSLSYQPDKIEDVLGDGSDHSVRLKYVTEPSPLGTGGAYKFAAASGQTTVVFNGDILIDADISKIIRHHQDAKADATIALTPVDDPSRYGLVETDADGNVKRFLEKPKPEEIASLGTNLINAGIYILEPAVLDLILAGANSSFEYNVFPEILARDMRFSTYSLAGTYWRDIGTPDSYLKAHLDFLADEIDGFLFERSAASEIATSAVIDKTSLIAEGCVIKPNAKIINSVIGTGVHIEEKAVIEDSVIWPHSRISTFAELRRAIVGRGCHIGRNTVVGEGSVLGDKASLPDYSKV